MKIGKVSGLAICVIQQHQALNDMFLFLQYLSTSMQKQFMNQLTYMFDVTQAFFLVPL